MEAKSRNDSALTVTNNSLNSSVINSSTTATATSFDSLCFTEEKIITVLLASALGFLCLLLLFLILRRRKIISIVFRTFSRDLKARVRFRRTMKTFRSYERRGLTVGTVFDQVVEKHPSKICFKGQGEEWTFLEVWKTSNRIGNYFANQGYINGDIVALFMENRPEFVCVWLGLSRIGVVTLLINSDLKGQALRHVFDIIHPKAVIYGEELSQELAEAFKRELSPEGVLPLYKVGSQLLELTSLPGITETDDDSEDSLPNGVRALNNKSKILEMEIKHANNTRPSSFYPIKSSDPLFYIYTSDYQGPPKAVMIKYSRLMMDAIRFHHMNHLRKEDVIYNAGLPLYHTAGGICGVGQALFWGNTVVIARKFSASRFWIDCIQNNVTVAQYIGEICRYLVSQSSSPEERKHRVRLMIGSGLRPEIWKEFTQRFNIHQISENYGSTLGNCNMMNFDNQIGAVGFVPILQQKRYPGGLIKVDEVTGEALRNPKTGLAIQCKPNEPGELVRKIVEKKPIHPFPEFQGYAGKDGKILTEKMILHDVFSKGDSVFRTGDYLVMDKKGYLYFRDRAADTYRWKGGNTSTAEVEAIIGKICNLKDCVVYGVKVPGTEGKCGMCTIADPESTLNLDLFADGVNKALPSYSRPLFLRLSNEIESTGTHKMKKFQLQHQGFDATKIRDPIYFYTTGKYVRLDEDLHFKIIGSEIKI